MNKSDKIDLISKAMIEIQKEMKNVPKDGKNPFFNNAPYATLDATLDLIRPIATKHGVAVIQSVEDADFKPKVTTLLVHESGQYFESSCCAGEVKPGPQPFGSNVSYLRRYALQGIFSTTGDPDDDGNKVQEPTKSIQTEKPKTTLPTTTKPPVTPKAESTVSQPTTAPETWTKEKIEKILKKEEWMKCFAAGLMGYKGVGEKYLALGSDREKLMEWTDAEIEKKAGRDTGI